MDTIGLTQLLKPLFKAANLPDDQENWAISQFNLMVTGKTVSKLQNTIPPDALQFLTSTLKTDPKPQDLEALYATLATHLPPEINQKIKSAVEESLLDIYQELAVSVISDASEEEKKELANGLLTLRASLTT